MLITTYRQVVFSLACVFMLSGPHSHRERADSEHRDVKPPETTVTELLASSIKFSEKGVRMRASYHSDGIDRDVLMEPNCGRFAGTSRAAPAGEPQCARGIVPVDKTENDPGMQDLVRASKQGDRGTMDKHITAEFTGIFRCAPSCVSPKYFSLEIERVEDLKVEMKDLKPHRPND
jgi:hypothetical protein